MPSFIPKRILGALGETSDDSAIVNINNKHKDGWIDRVFHEIVSLFSMILSLYSRQYFQRIVSRSNAQKLWSLSLNPQSQRLCYLPSTPVFLSAFLSETTRDDVYTIPVNFMVNHKEQRVMICCWIPLRSCKKKKKSLQMDSRKENTWDIWFRVFYSHQFWEVAALQ